MFRRDPIRARRLPRAVLAGLFALTLLPVSVAAQSSDDQGIYSLTGSVEPPPAVAADFDESAVILLDLSVEEGTPPSPGSQVMAQLTGDFDDEVGFTMALPARPLGGTIDITGGDEEDVPQVYSIDITANTSETQFIEPSDLYGGSATLFSSLSYDLENAITGQVLVWSSGDGEVFPSAPGDDGLALTEDDPTDELDPGWTLVDLDDDEYTWTRDAETEMTFAADGISPNDFTDQGWTEAFDSLVVQLEAEYAFSDIKDIDFDALRDEYRPRIEEAEADDDLDAYSLALYEFGLEFNDGHVSASLPAEYFLDAFDGSFGLEVGQTDEGDVFVTAIADSRSADDEGVRVGDRLVTWDGDDVEDRLADLDVPVSWSSPHDRDVLATRWLTRAAVGTEVDVTVRDDDGDERTVTLRATRDDAGLNAAFTSADSGNEGAMPIESRVLPSGVGYIRIDTFATNFILFTHQWDYALRTFQELGISELVIDMRSNGGGYLGLAVYASASFVEDPFNLNDAYLNDGDGGYVRVYDDVIPSAPRHWTGSVAVMVDSGCASSCEHFSATLSRIDSDIINVIGYTPSAGVYAAIQSWDLPDGLYFQAAQVRFQVGDDVYLEGQGVPLDVDVPVTEGTLLDGDDELLGIAEDVAQGDYEPDEG